MPRELVNNPLHSFFPRSNLAQLDKSRDRAFDAWDAARFAAEVQKSSGKNAYSPIRGLLLSAPQLICKLLYLFFPRDIHDSFGIVV